MVRQSYVPLVFSICWATEWPDTREHEFITKILYNWDFKPYDNVMIKNWYRVLNSHESIRIFPFIHFIIISQLVYIFPISEISEPALMMCEDV